jgi:hypothetical protein
MTKIAGTVILYYPISHPMPVMLKNFLLSTTVKITTRR